MSDEMPVVDEEFADDVIVVSPEGIEPIADDAEGDAIPEDQPGEEDAE